MAQQLDNNSPSWKWWRALTEQERNEYRAKHVGVLSREEIEILYLGQS